MNYKTQLPIIIIIIIIITIFLLATAGCESKNQLKWEPFTNEKVAEAAQLEKPAIAYFYAAWCGSCYQLKERTFSDPQVIQALDAYVRLKGDLSFMRSQKTMEVSRRYQIQGVPTVILFNSKGQVAKRFSGFMPPDQFLALLKQLTIESPHPNPLPEGEGVEKYFSPSHEEGKSNNFPLSHGERGG